MFGKWLTRKVIVSNGVVRTLLPRLLKKDLGRAVVLRKCFPPFCNIFHGGSCSIAKVYEVKEPCGPQPSGTALPERGPAQRWLSSGLAPALHTNATLLAMHLTGTPLYRLGLGRGRRMGPEARFVPPASPLIPATPAQATVSGRRGRQHWPGPVLCFDDRRALPPSQEASGVRLLSTTLLQPPGIFPTSQQVPSQVQTLPWGVR